MPAKGTPWANTLRSTGLIFMQDRWQSKLSQVAGYVIGVAAPVTGRRQLVFDEKISAVRVPAAAVAAGFVVGKAGK